MKAKILAMFIHQRLLKNIKAAPRRFRSSMHIDQRNTLAAFPVCPIQQSVEHHGEQPYQIICSFIAIGRVQWKGRKIDSIFATIIYGGRMEQRGAF